MSYKDDLQAFITEKGCDLRKCELCIHVKHGGCKHPEHPRNVAGAHIEIDFTKPQKTGLTIR